MKTLYEIRNFDIETKNGINAYDQWINKDNQCTDLLKAFEDEDEAKAFYEKVNTGVKVLSGGRGKYYLHSGKVLEKNVYDDDGDWIEGLEVAFCLPDYEFNEDEED